MKISLDLHRVKKIIFVCFFGTALSLSSLSFVSVLPILAISSDVFSTEEKPFGITYDDWIARYWNWDFSLTNKTVDPQANSCIMGQSESMVFVYNPASGGDIKQICTIPEGSGILIPLWTAYCDESNKGKEKYTYEELTKCAREEYDQGRVAASVDVDGHQVGLLIEELRGPLGGPLKYTVDSLINVNELYSKGFNITVPKDSHRIGDFPHAGDYRSGAHGWYVFLRPLTVGDHTVTYKLDVKEYEISAVVTYNFHVR